MSVLQKRDVDVAAKGEVVVLTIGHAQAKLHYRTALRVGHHMRANAKSCMRFVEDTKRHWSEVNQTPAPSSDGVGSRSFSDFLKTLRLVPLPLKPTTPNKKISVENFGDTVRLHLGSNTHVDFHYTDALELSGWLRTRGKEAKLNAGDKTRELHAIGVLHDAASN